MAKYFFGFALANSMFDGVQEESASIELRRLTPQQVREMARDGVLIPCLNPSHRATIDAMHTRFGIYVEIPDAPPKATLTHGDSVIVMGVHGLPRLTDRHEYTPEEIASATFDFTQYTVK